MDEAVARKLWLQAIERVKDQTHQPSLWRALEVSRGITLDDDVFVIGFNSQDYPQSGLLRSSEHRTIIERTLAGMLGLAQVRIRTIEGMTLSEYQHIRHQEDILDTQRRVAMDRQTYERTSEYGWETVLETLSRSYTQIHLRQLPQTRAKFIKEALSVISNAMDKNYPENPDDVTERALARAIDKVATLTETPAALIAMELWKIREG
jgi:hypothetical protein